MLRLLAALLVIVAVGVGGFGLGRVWLERWWTAPGPLAGRVVVTLPRGAGVAAITRRLTEAGVAGPDLALRLGYRLLAEGDTLKAGEYAFEPGISPAEAIAKIARGDVLLHPVSVPEGLTVREVYDLLRTTDVLAGPLPLLPAEGSLLPETYLVPRGEPRARLVATMGAQREAALERAWAAREDGLPLEEPEAALVLASIIEKETARPDEYGRVASVFVNRLRRGMKLQTDPSVIYGLTEGAGPLGRTLTAADLRVGHDWNTYVIDGLPPTPIANPGRAAIEAAVRPDDTDYLYFVADGTGGHVFARTLDEHNRNVARWRRQQRQRQPEAGG